MPGLTIHVAIGKRFMEKHANVIKDRDLFIKGCISPDLVSDKNISHYGIWTAYESFVDIKKFLDDPKVDMSNDYWLGYFSHLLADYLFYNKYFKEEITFVRKINQRFYNDYNALNLPIRKKYKIDVIDSIYKYMEIYEGEPEFLNTEKVFYFIEKISDMDLFEKIDIIKNKGMSYL